MLGQLLVFLRRSGHLRGTVVDRLTGAGEKSRPLLTFPPSQRRSGGHKPLEGRRLGAVAVFVAIAALGVFWKSERG